MRGVKEAVVTWATEDDVEVHAVDADGRVVLDTEINVFLDTKPKVSRVGEIVSPQLVLTHLKQRQKFAMTKHQSRSFQ